MTEEQIHQRAADAGWMQKQQRRITELEASANAVCHEADQILKERGRRLTLQEKVVEIGNVLADSQQEVADLRSKRGQLEAENARLRGDHAQLRDALAIAQTFVSDFRAHGIDDNLRAVSVSGIIRHALKTTKTLANHSGDANKMVVGGKEGA